jgi:deoxyribose-phosphate aldolase
MCACGAVQRGERLHSSLLPGAVREVLAGTTVHASTTIGFPHGGHRTEIKVAEARQALKDGGQELDVVINISKARSGDWQFVSTMS